MSHNICYYQNSEGGESNEVKDNQYDWAFNTVISFVSNYGYLWILSKLHVVHFHSNKTLFLFSIMLVIYIIPIILAGFLLKPLFKSVSKSFRTIFDYIFGFFLAIGYVYLVNYWMGISFSFNGMIVLAVLLPLGPITGASLLHNLNNKTKNYFSVNT